MEGVAGYEPQGAFLRHIQSLLPDNDRQLHFPIYFGTVPGNHQGIVRSNQRCGGLEENDRLFRQLHLALCGMVAKVQTDAHDLARPTDWRPQTNRRRYSGPGFAVPIEPRAECGHPAALKKRLVVVSAKRGNVHSYVIVERGTRAAAQAYLEFLYTEEGQRLVGKHFYRPRLPAVAKEFAAQFPVIDLPKTLEL